MSTLAGQKVKDKYGNLLHVEGGLTGTLKTVEDGSGSTSPLKLSTSAVEVSALSFATAPTTDNTELTAILIDGSSNLVKRELGTNAFSSTPGVTDAVFVARSESAYTLTDSLDIPTWASIDNSGSAASYEFGDREIMDFSNETAGAIRVTEAGVYRIEVSLFFEVTVSNTDVTIKLDTVTGGISTTLDENVRSKSSSGNFSASYFYIKYLEANTDIRMQISKNSSGGASLDAGSVFSVIKYQ